MKVALFAVIAVLLVGNGIALSSIDPDGAPSQWDPRVAALARYVEGARHLRFVHPVDVEFLDEKSYEKRAAGDSGALTDADKADIANEEGELRALGLLKKGVSLYDDTTKITSGGTLAFYDPDDDVMVIRGTKLTVGMKVTTVHELTHALQDQHFNLSRDFSSATRSEFFHALAEGDATRIENEYIDALSDGDAADYNAEVDRDQHDAEEAIADVSPFLTQYFGAPYALGEPLTSIVVTTKDDAGLNALFRNPPASDATLMDPFALLAGARPVRVSRPKVQAGERLTRAGDFGALRWYLMLSSFVDQKVALNATDGWRGDAFSAYRKGGRSCVRATFAGDTTRDIQEMRAALEQWKSAFGSASVIVGGDERLVDFESCEPPNAPNPVAGSDRALSLPVVRYTLVREILDGGGSTKLARCGVRELFNRLTIDQLNPQTEAEAKPLQAAVPQVARFCRTHGEA